jgi:hypothetical protein
MEYVCFGCVVFFAVFFNYEGMNGILGGFVMKIVGMK